MKKIYGTFGVEMRAYGQKLVKFCKHRQTHASKLVVALLCPALLLHTSLFPGTGVSTILVFSPTFFTTDATFTYPLAS